MLVSRSMIAAMVVSGLAASGASARITFDLDYSLDTNNFFNPGTANGQAARAALTFAADTFSDRLLDSLTQVSDEPVEGTEDGNDWTPRIRHPATGVSNLSFPSLTVVPANTLKVFAGGRDESGSTLGVGGPGGYGTSYYDDAWNNNVKSRGQADALLALPTDFGPWGGTISFDTPTNWNFSIDAPPSSGSQSDFLSVALHELAHLIGFGTAASFTQSYTSALIFTGPKATALNGGTSVPLANAGHLSASIISTVTGSDAQQPGLSPSITQGTRKRLTLMDWAVLDDIGWDLARPGDANADATVDFDDLLTLAQNYGATSQVTWSEGDFNYTGTVDFDDLLSLAQNYGTSGPLLQQLQALSATGSGDFAADVALAFSIVPEPTSIAGMAALATLLRRRR